MGAAPFRPLKKQGTKELRGRGEKGGKRAKKQAKTPENERNNKKIKIVDNFFQKSDFYPQNTLKNAVFSPKLDPIFPSKTPFLEEFRSRTGKNEKKRPKN